MIYNVVYLIVCVILYARVEIIVGSDNSRNLNKSTISIEFKFVK